MRPQQQLKAIIRQLNADTGRTFGIASQVKGEYAGYTRYRHCLYELVEGVTYKRTRWTNTHADLVPIVHAYAQKHTTSTKGAA